jgi:ElaA protein
MPYRWQTAEFTDLGEEALYRVLHLRQAVFVIEQACLYQDLDGLDQRATHMLCWTGDQLAAYLRCLPPGTSYAESSIGRIVVAADHRDKGLGRDLVARGIAYNNGRWPDSGIRINAQSYLGAFYRALGFCAVGEQYDEDGIPHQQMLYRPAETA